MAYSLLRKKLDKLITLARSSLVGVMATASDLSTLFLLVHFGGLSEQVANIPSLIPGLVVMYFGNKFFAFEDKSTQYVKQGSLFLLIEFGAFLLNIVLFHLITSYTRLHVQLAALVGSGIGYLGIGEIPELHLMLARMIGTALAYFGFSFPMWSLFVFKRPDKGATDSPGALSAPVATSLSSPPTTKSAEKDTEQQGLLKQVYNGKKENGKVPSEGIPPKKETAGVENQEADSSEQ